MEGGHPILALALALALALVHVFAGRLRFLSGTPRSRWLSTAGGISVAYVFVQLLPELNKAEEAVSQEAQGALPFLESHVYLLALAGLALFYGVELSSRRSRKGDGNELADEPTGPRAFWLSVGSFAVYNALVGYLLLHREESTVKSLTLFAAALGLHFVVNDYGLREHHKSAYDHVARWVLAASVPLGWAVGQIAEISEAALGLLLAFLAGGVILNVLKEELPEQRQSRFSAFALGALGYTVLLQAI